MEQLQNIYVTINSRILLQSTIFYIICKSIHTSRPNKVRLLGKKKFGACNPEIPRHDTNLLFMTDVDVKFNRDRIG